MIIDLECNYCGHKWQMNPSYQGQLEGTICPKCKDSSLKMKDSVKSKVDYYQGCPPFPVKWNPFGSYD